MAVLDVARHVKHKLYRRFVRDRSMPVNLQAHDPAFLDRDVGYAMQVARNYLNQLQSANFSLANARILELGPGHEFGAQLLIASHGAHVTVADRFLAPWDENYHPFFYRTLRARWPGPAGALDAVIDAGGYPDRVIGRIPVSAEQLGRYGSARFDCVLSNAVLEHVENLRRVAENLAQLTKSPGLNLHQIDFRDHRDQSRPLEFLLLSARKQRDLFRSRHGEPGNRLRLKEAIAIFEAAGFTCAPPENQSFCDDAYLAEFLPQLRRSQSDYVDWPVEDLRVIGARLVLRK
jgi:hypothetical protein